MTDILKILIVIAGVVALVLLWLAYSLSKIADVLHKDNKNRREDGSRKDED